MNILLHRRYIYYSFFIITLLNFSALAAQSWRATPLNHPDGTLTAVGVNNSGQIAVTVTDTNFISHALRREADGQFTPLTELNANISQAFGMNELGHVIGIALNDFVFEPVIWEDSEPRILDRPANTVSVFPADLNNSGIATGRFLDTTFTSHAIVWDSDGSVERLPELDGVSSEAAAINEKGEIVGFIWLENNWSRAVLWQPDDTAYVATDIGTLGGPGAFATDINNNSQIVGYSYLETGFNVHAFFWENEKMIDLGTLGGDNSRAFSINDDGFIVGASQDSSSGMGKIGSVSGISYAQTVGDIGRSASPTVRGQLQPGGIDIAFYTTIRKNWQDEYKSPRLLIFDVAAQLNRAILTNLSRGVLAFSELLSVLYYLESNTIRYTSLGAGPGYPGQSYNKYGTLNDALSDNRFNVDYFKLYAPPFSSFSLFNIPVGKSVSLFTATGSGSTLQHGQPGSINIDYIVLAPGSSLKTGYGGFTSMQTNNIEIYGKWRSQRNFNIIVSTLLMLSNPYAYIRANLVLGPTAVILLNQGYIGGVVQVNNPDFADDIVGRHNAAPGTAAIEGGSSASAITGKASLHINSATGENGGYIFHMKSKDGPWSPLYVMPEITPETPLNVIAESLVKNETPESIIDSLNLGELFLLAVIARYGMKVEDRSVEKRSVPTQNLTSTIRVAVDSIDITEDPNRYRLLLFDYNGEFISQAGTFVPYDGSSPTTAVYTGFIDSMLNVSHRNVTITDSVILVLAKVNLESDIDSQAEPETITTYELAQNFPNPFNPLTKITFTIPKPEYVTLTVYNTLGQKVATLFDSEMSAGAHGVQFDASDLPSGVYIYRIQAGEFSQVRKMVLMK